MRNTFDLDLRVTMHYGNIDLPEAEMHHVLKRHPDSRGSAALRVEFDVTRPRASHLMVSCIVAGAMRDVQIPRLTTPTRTNDLWRHTCFEAFVRTVSEPSYYEFNFAPSTQWAAYRFSNYRNGIAAAEIDTPSIEVQSDSDRTALRVSLALDRLLDLPREASWRLGLSAVIEDRRGSMSYWALAHPPGKPDFHHADCFALELSSVGNHEIWH
jgi:hypothetical protein